MLDKIRVWRKNPVQMVRDEFGVEPDEWQKDVLMACVTNMRTAMKACKGPGKTCLLAWIAWWFLVTRPHPKVIATSISEANLSDGLWTEMAKWQNKSKTGITKELFTWTKTRIFYNEHPETWWMSARTWSKGAASEQQANTLAGIHADYVLFILDEAGGIPDAVVAAAEAALANDMGQGSGTEAKLVIAGNPTHLEGPLYRACTTESRLWYVKAITSDPDDPKRTPRVSKDWARQQIEKYGRDNPWVLVNVFGEFPPSSLNALLGVEEVEAAMGRCHHAHDYEFMQKRLGIDVARYGDDSTVIFPRQGLQAFQFVLMKNANNNQISGRVMQAKFKWGSEAEFVDGTGGFGSGVVDNLLLNGITAQEIHSSSKAINPRYANKRAEMYFEAAEWIKRGGALPRDEGLKKELVAPTYTFDKSGRLLLESKDDIKLKLSGDSPDKADAFCLTFALPEQRSDIITIGRQQLNVANLTGKGRAKTERDEDRID